MAFQWKAEPVAFQEQKKEIRWEYKDLAYQTDTNSAPMAVLWLRGG